MKITYRRTSFNVKERKIHLEDIDVILPKVNGNGITIETLGQFYVEMNKWNQAAQLNAQAGLPIYVYTVEKVEI